MKKNLVSIRLTGWKKVGDVDARRSAGGLMLPWSSVVFVVQRLTPSYLPLQYIAAAAFAACRTPLLFWSSREPHGIFTKTLGLHSCSHQTAVAACCRYCSCCFYTLANKVASVAEFPIVSFDVANDLVFITWSLRSEFISFNLVSLLSLLWFNKKNHPTNYFCPRIFTTYFWWQCAPW